MGTPVHADFVRAFTPGTVFRDSTGRETPVEQHDAGELVLTTGRVLACDPGYLQVQGPESLRAYTRAVPPGRYPVSLCVAVSHYTVPGETPDAPRRPVTQHDVAIAMIRFSDAEPLRWELALTPGQDPAKLLPDQFFGYGVDGGNGCFTDEQIIDVLAPERDEFREMCQRGMPAITSFEDVRNMHTPFFRRLHDGFFGNPAAGKEMHVTVVADPRRGLNLIAFRSGIGDGAYPSFWGLDARGNPCRLATDFGLLVESFEETLTFPLGNGLRTFVHHELVARGVAAIEVREEDDSAPDRPPTAAELLRSPSTPEELRPTLQNMLRSATTWPGSNDYKLTLRVRLVGRTLYHSPQVRVNGREYHCASCGSDYWFHLDQPLTGDAELLVKYISRTVPL